MLALTRRLGLCPNQSSISPVVCKPIAFRCCCAHPMLAEEKWDVTLTHSTTDTTEEEQNTLFKGK